MFVWYGKIWRLLLFDFHTCIQLFQKIAKKTIQNLTSLHAFFYLQISYPSQKIISVVLVHYLVPQILEAAICVDKNLREIQLQLSSTYGSL